MDLRQLKYFRAVCEAGSFTKAATKLAVTQPALSKHIKILESELGIQLFYRHGRGVLLTDEGQELLKKAVPILLQIQEIKATFNPETRKVTGKVRLGLPPSIAAAIGADLMCAFSEIHPQASLLIIDAYSGYINELLVDGRIDLAVLNRAIRAPHISLDHLTTESLHVICHQKIAQAHGFVEGETIPLTKAVKLPLVLPSSHHGLRRIIENVAREQDLDVNIQAECDSLSVVHDLVAKARYATILPVSTIREISSVPEISSWRLVAPALKNELMLGASLHKPMTAAVQSVLDLLKERISSTEKTLLE